MIRVTIKDDDGKVIQSMTYQMDMTYPMEVMVQEPKPAPKKKESFSLVGLAGKGIKNRRSWRNQKNYLVCKRERRGWSLRVPPCENHRYLSVYDTD